MIRDARIYYSTAISKEGFRGSLDIYFPIIPDFVWVEENVKLVEEYWDIETRTYYGLFMMENLKFEEIRNNDLMYRPVIKNFDISFLCDIGLFAWDLYDRIPDGSKIAIINFTHENESVSEHYIEDITAGFF